MIRRCALMLATALALPMFPCVADVGDIWLTPYSTTKHFRIDHYHTPENYVYKLHDSHPSVGFEYTDKPGKTIGVGVYRDSYGGTAAYVARRTQYAYGLGLTAGVLISGQYPNKLVPFFGPELSYQAFGVKISAAFLPSYGARHQPNLGVIQIAFKL